MDNFVELLATATGISALTAFIVTVFKRVLPERVSESEWYGLVVVLSSIAIGMILSVLGLYILDIFDTGATLAEALLRGVIGGLSATGLYEGVKNIQKGRSGSDEADPAE